jgi:molybdate transport system substrate-binding protein
MTNRFARAALLAAGISAFIFVPAQNLAAQHAESGAEIHILCSNGFHAAMEKLLPQAERASGRAVKVEFGASANFKRSIENGDAFDLAIVTPQIAADLVKEGKIAPGTTVDLASTGTGLAVRAGRPKPDVSTAAAIKKTLLDAKSISYVKVGAGTPAIVDMLNRLGISEDVQRKAVFQPGAERSMAGLAAGETDVAFALISEILASPGVQLAGPLPPEFQRKVIMSAGISASTKNRAAMNAIVQSLTSASAAPTIKAVGMDPIGAGK